MKNATNRRRLFIGSMLAGALAVTTAAYAGPHCKKGGKHGKWSAEDKAAFMEKRMERMASKLELTDEQKEGMKSLMENHRNAMKPLHDEKRAIRQEMMNLDPKADDYAAKLADIANRKAEISRQITIARGEKRQKMAQLLTPEQLAKKQEMRAEHGKRRGMRHHGH